MSKIETKYLIIGNSTAAIAGVEGIRSLDEEGDITLISAEPEHTYSRPLIPYLLSGEIDEKRMFYRPANFYEKNRVRAILGCEVARVEDDKKFVYTAKDDAVYFEKLLIATGGATILPNVPDITSEGVFTFLTWQDSVRIKKFIQNKKVRKAVVVGAGLIGIKTMEALLALHVKVDVVELAKYALSAMLDEHAAALVHKKLAREGVTLHCNTTVLEVLSRYDVVSGVRLANGDSIDCDILIFAIGVLPNIAIVKDTAIRTDKGILVDDRMQTSVPDIYAAGDASQGYDFLLNVNRPIAIFPNAYQQGRVAGINMAGGDQAFAGGMAMNSLRVCDLPIISVGVIQPDGASCEVLSRMDETRSVYKKVVLKDNRIIGALFVNEVDRAGIYTGLIRYRLDVSEIHDQLMADNFGLITLPMDYRKYVVSGMGIEI